MKIWDVQQNTEQWMQLRSTIPTASEMHRVVMASEGTLYQCEDCGTNHPRTRKTCSSCGSKSLISISVVRPSSQQDGYMYQLIAASFGWIKQRPQNAAMDRGHEAEPRAIAAYEMIKGYDTEVVGFCTTDDGLIGCSPDRLVGDEGMVEAKSSDPDLHLQHLVEKNIGDEHRVQVQSQLLVTGRKWVDVVGYCDGFPPECHIPRTIIIRVERDEPYISGMNDRLVEFVTKLHQTRAELIEKYGEYHRQIPPDVLGVTDEDVDSILAARRQTV